MTFTQFTKLACSLMVAATLTACGGGGEKGPVWAQQAKVLLSTPDDTTGETFPPEAPEYYADCIEDLLYPGYSLRESVAYSMRDGKAVLLFKIRYYKNTDCARAGRLYVATYPEVVYTLENAVPGLLEGTSAYESSVDGSPGPLSVSIENASEVTVTRTASVDGGAIDATLVVVNGARELFVADQTRNASKDLLYVADQYLYLGDLDSIDLAVSPYPQQLLVDAPYPYTLSN